jgi:hypothetical protein
MWIFIGIIILEDHKIKDQFREYDFSNGYLYILVGCSLVLFGALWLYSTYKKGR